MAEIDNSSIKLQSFMALVDASNEAITTMLFKDEKYKKFLKNKLCSGGKGPSQVADAVDDTKAQ